MTSFWEGTWEGIFFLWYVFLDMAIILSKSGPPPSLWSFPPNIPLPVATYLKAGQPKDQKNLFNSRFMVKLSVPDPKNILDFFFSETTNQHFINACPDAHRLFLPGNWKIFVWPQQNCFFSWYVFTETYPGIFNSLWKFLACVTDPLWPEIILSQHQQQKSSSKNFKKLFSIENKSFLNLQSGSIKQGRGGSLTCGPAESYCLLDAHDQS